MKIEIREVYKCEYCNKMYQRKHHCVNHEKSCKKRPDYLRPCHNCNVLKEVKETIFTAYKDEFGDKCRRDINVLFCEKIDSFIYPPSVAAKGNAFKLSKSNIEMPKKCDFYIANSFDDIFNDIFI